MQTISQNGICALKFYSTIDNWGTIAYQEQDRACRL